MQCTAELSSNLLRQTLQNLRLTCVGSDQQWATGFLIRQGAIPEQGVTTFVTHFSCTMKLQAEKWTQLVGKKLHVFIAQETSQKNFFFCFLFIMKNSFCESSKTSNKLSNCVLSSCVDAFPSKEKLNLLRVEYWMYDDVKRHAFFEKKREKNVMRIRRRCFQCYAALDHSEFRVSKYEELRICRDFWCLGSVEWHMNITYLLVFFDSCSCGSDDYDKHVSIFFGAF